jgi:hypothetical protein
MNRFRAMRCAPALSPSVEPFGLAGFAASIAIAKGGHEVANWLYVAGSLCFLLGTIINMWGAK